MEKTNLPIRATAITTLLQAHQWETALKHHPNQEFARYIITGIREGFRIGFDRSRCRPISATRNMLSTIQNPKPVREYLNTELEARRIVEVGDEVKDLVVSRFGLIPKKDQRDKWRLIQDLSYPNSRSINDRISKDLSSLSYVTVDEAVEQILCLGKGTLLAKVDVKQAYRNVPIHPDDRHLLGMGFRWPHLLRHYFAIWPQISPEDLYSTGRCPGVDREGKGGSVADALHRRLLDNGQSRLNRVRPQLRHHCPLVQGTRAAIEATEGRGSNHNPRVLGHHL